MRYSIINNKAYKLNYSQTNHDMRNHHSSCSPLPESIQHSLWLLCILCRLIQLASGMKINLFSGADLGLFEKLPAQE